MIGYVILGRTILCPFFTIDDSDTLRRTAKFMMENGWESIFKIYIPDIDIKRRYWPGQYQYNMLRIYLFGFNSIPWHLFHIGTFCTLGFSLSILSRRFVNSILPGIFAFIFILTAGIFNYQSTWFAYVYTMSIEPTMTIVWAIAAAAFATAHIAETAWKRRLWFWPALILTFYSVTLKENAFPVTFGVSITFLVITFKAASIRKSERIAAIIIAICSVLWGAWVYSALPKDEGYGGIQSLNLSVASFWTALKSIKDLVFGSSGYLVPISVIHFMIRTVLQRPNIMFPFLLLTFAVCQIITIIFWPNATLRLIQPAMTALGLFCFCELYIWTSHLRPQQFKPSVLWAGIIPVILIGLFAQAGSGVFGFGVMVLSAIAGCVYMSKRKNWLDWFAYSSGCVAIGVLALGLLVNGISHVYSYPKLYETTELLRHRSVAQACQVTERAATVAWLVDPGQEIFPYSSDMHADLFFDRADLKILPYSTLKDRGTPLKRGDMFLFYGSRLHTHLKDAALTYYPVVEGGYISPILSFGEYIAYLQKILQLQFRRDDLKLRYHGATLNMYRIESDNWRMPIELVR